MLLLLFFLVQGTFTSWQFEEKPKISVDYLNLFSNAVESFIGNQTTSDHFKLLNQDGGSLLIGARNIVYNISLDNLKENAGDRITWGSRDRDTELCLVKGKNDDDCNNYIRVLAKTSDDQLLVCGTNSYNPRCRYYKLGDKGVYEVEKEFSGKGYCPFDPKHNSTSLFTGGSLYSGTVSDFSGSDALIIKDQIRTEQYNLKHLNSPDFVGSAEDGDFVYFFFREQAVEFINCGKRVYSRVARVCKKDTGGPRTFKNKWTTFLKARLNCSVPGQFPFYFDEIQSVHQVGDRIFGVFNTPDNSISGSAVCSFKMADIAEAFAGEFKVQENSNSNWLATGLTDTKRPGACHDKPEDLSEKHLNFIKNNVLMDSAVPSSVNIPHFVRTSPHEKLTTVAVDADVPTADGKLVDVLFVGTTRGRVLKMASFSNGGIPQTNLIEELQLFPYHVAVNNIIVLSARNSSQNGGIQDGGGNIIAVSDHEVKKVPVQRCAAKAIQSCASCVNLQDPYCAWNVGSGECLVAGSSPADTSNLVQSVNTGTHQTCNKHKYDLKNSVYDYEPIGFHALPRESLFRGSGVQYSAASMATAIILSGSLCLVVGAVAGTIMVRKYYEKHSYLKCGHAYLEAQAMDRTKAETSHYTEPNFSLTSASKETPFATTVTTKNNLLANIPEKTETTKNNISISASGSKKIYI